jgi:geranylgeranyl pyrophosphate synthase
MIHFLKTAPAEHRALMRSLLTDPSADRAERLRNLILPSDSLDYARSTAQHLAKRARAQLDALPDSDAKRALDVMAEFVVSRAM